MASLYDIPPDTLTKLYVNTPLNWSSSDYADQLEKQRAYNRMMTGRSEGSQFIKDLTNWRNHLMFPLAATINLGNIIPSWTEKLYNMPLLKGKYRIATPSDLNSTNTTKESLFNIGGMGVINPVRIPEQQSNIVYDRNNPVGLMNAPEWQPNRQGQNLPTVTERELLDYEAREAAKVNQAPFSIARPEENIALQKSTIEKTEPAQPWNPFQDIVNKKITYSDLISKRPKINVSLAEEAEIPDIPWEKTQEEPSSTFLDELNRAYKRGVAMDLLGMTTQLPTLFQRRREAPEIDYGTFEAPRFQTMGAALKKSMQADVDRQLATARKLSREMGKPEVSLAANVQAEEAMLKANIAALTADTETINKTLEAVANANNMTEQSRVEASRLKQQYQLTLDQGTDEQRAVATSNIMEYLNRLANLDTQRFQSVLTFEEIQNQKKLNEKLLSIETFLAKYPITSEEND